MHFRGEVMIVRRISGFAYCCRISFDIPVIGCCPGEIFLCSDSRQEYVGSIELDSSNVEQSQYVAWCQLLSVLGIFLA